MNTNWDDWVSVDAVLAFVFPGPRDLSVREHIAKARQESGALSESRYLAACAMAGIEVRWDAGRAYIPTWAAPFLEATITRRALQARVMKHAASDVRYRNAGLTAWRLGGVGGLALWLDQQPLVPR